MARPLSMDLRERVAVALEEGETVRSAAKRFGVSVASAVRIGQRQRSGRGQAPGQIGGSRRAALAGEPGRVSDLLCMGDLVHASSKGSMNDDFQRDS